MVNTQEYFDALKTGGKSECTIRNYSKDVAKFIKFFNIESYQDIEKLNKSDYMRFISSLDTLSPSSINALIRNLSAYFNWLIDEAEVITKCDFLKTKFGQKRKFVKEPKNHKDILTDEEVEKMLNAATNKQHKFMIGLMVWTGLRSNELRSIKIKDIKNGEAWIHGKGSKEREIAFNPILEGLYNEYMESRDTNCQYLFYSNYQDGKLTSKTIIDRIAKVYKDAGLSGKNITAHSFRRTAANNIKKEYDVLVAQYTLGHSSLQTTEKYLQKDNSYIKETMKKTTRKFGL